MPYGNDSAPPLQIDCTFPYGGDEVSETSAFSRYMGYASRGIHSVHDAICDIVPKSFGMNSHTGEYLIFMGAIASSVIAKEAGLINCDTAARFGTGVICIAVGCGLLYSLVLDPLDKHLKTRRSD